MPVPTRTARERWSQFLSFVVVWVLAAIVGSALLFYFTGSSDPVPTAPEPEPAPVVLNNDAPEPAPAPAPEVALPTPASESSIERVRNDVRDEPPPRTQLRAMSDGERASKVAADVRAAATATDASDYQAAILAYESALELEPNNFEVKILMSQVMSLRELEARDAGQRFQETRTEAITDGSRRQSTEAELFIEILPAAPNPGDPYVLRVRAHNASEQGLEFASVELVEAQDSMKRERGRAVTPLAQRLGPKETALLWERRSDWTVEDRTGTIDVVVVLADGSRLFKSLRW